MTKASYYGLLVLILMTFCANAQRMNESNTLAYQPTTVTRKFNHLLQLYQNKKNEDSLMTYDNYQSYRTAYIISESIGASLIGLYARSSWNNGTSTNIGFLYSGIGVSIIGFLLNLKANKIKTSNELAVIHDVLKIPILTIVPLLSSEKSFHKVGVIIRF
jgi:hypothetical protein